MQRSKPQKRNPNQSSAWIWNCQDKMFLQLIASPLCLFLFPPPVSFQGTRGGHRQKPRPPYYGKRQPLGLKIPNCTKLSLCPMTSFAKKMRPGVDVPREAVSYSTARAVLGRRALFQMAFSERQGGVSRPANGTVDLFNMHLSYSFFTYPSSILFCAYAQAPLKFQGLFLSSFDTKKRKGLVTNVSSGAVPGHLARI